MLPMLSFVTIIVLHLLCLSCNAQEMETITGTIFVDNEFSFYVNGELIAEDPVPIYPHNAVNVTFEVPKGKNITFAIDARDWANETTGLEWGNRCVGDGGLRAIFSNGVVTNSSWVCSTYFYGPINWRECFAAQTVRNQSDQLLPQCKQESVPMLEGCYTRTVPRPEGWNLPGFDYSHWEYALEWEDDVVGWGLRPAGCNDPNTIISPELDPNGNNITCPENLNWGESKFIWRPDLLLDNYILCRYTLQLEADSGAIHFALGSIVTLALTAAAVVIFSVLL